MTASSASTGQNISDRKPQLSIISIINMSLGFFGLQMGFALQNANASRIFSTLGADIDLLPLLWLAGPVTGLIVQPIVGYMSDRTWTRFGRRRPYFFIGAILATFALLVMPLSPVLWIAASSLWILDASLNISMEPFRAFVGDNLPSKQRTLGYAMQGIVIGAGGWLASNLPNFLTKAGVANQAAEHVVPDAVKFAFFIGAGLLFLTVLWTIVTSKEYSPDQLKRFEAAETSEISKIRQAERPVPPKGFFALWGGILLAIGAALTALIPLINADKQFFVFTIGMMIAGTLFMINFYLVGAGRTKNFISEVLGDLATMPKIMKRLALVQFTTWFAFFILWIYVNPAVTTFHYGSDDPTSAAHAAGSLVVNNFFGQYSIIAMFFTFLIPLIVGKIGLRLTHSLCLIAGGLGLISFFLLTKDTLTFKLIGDWGVNIPAIGIGIAWGAVLTLPYAILSDSLPVEKMGIYMGIFNFFIVIPQIIVGTVMGPVVKNLLGAQPVLALVVGGCVMILGAAFMALVPYRQEMTEP